MTVWKHFKVIIFASAVFLPTMTLNADTNRTASAPSWTPIIPLPLGDGPIPFMENALADPWLREKTADNRDSPDELYEKAANLIESLRHANDAGDKLKMTEELYMSLGMLSYYLAGLEAFKQEEVKSIRKDSSVTLDYIRRLFALYAREFARISSDNIAKKRALFHAYTASALSDDLAHCPTEEVVAMISDPAAKDFRSQLKLLSSMISIEQNRLFINHESITHAGANLPVDNQIMLNLYAARALAKLRTDGDPGQTEDVSSYLLEGVKLAKQLPADASQKVYIYALRLWREQKGNDASWENPPVVQPGFSEPPILAALKERQALYLLTHKDSAGCLALYLSLDKDLKNMALRAEIDNRILDIYQTTAAVDPTRLLQYFGAIDRKIVEYNGMTTTDPNDSQLIKKTLKRLQARKMNVGLQTTNIPGDDSKTAKEIRRYVIDQLAVQVDETQDKNLKKKLRQKIGVLHEVNHNPLAALENYKSALEIATSENEKYQCLSAIVRVQSLIAGWPIKPPWNEALPTGDNEEFDVLYQYYAQMLPVAPPTVKWRILAHMGLLLLQKNSKEAAFQLWSRYIDAKPANRNQQYAAGMILGNEASGLKSKNAQTVALAVRKAGIKPIYQGASLNVDEILANILYTNAERAVKESNFQQAASLLTQFLAITGKNDSRLENATFLLADAYLSLASPQFALKYIMRYVNDYPDGSQTKYLLLKGLTRTKDISTPLSATYALLYLKYFKKGSGAGMAREMLTKYYMQKERYDDAAKVYQWQVMAEDLSREKQLEAAQAYWELKKKTGDKEAALWGAKQIIRLAKDHPEAVAKAYLFEAEYFAAENNMQELSGAARSLAALDNGPPVIRRTLAYIKNLMAQHGAEVQLGSPHATASTDPTSLLHELYASYLKQKRELDDRCKRSGNECLRARRDAQKFAQSCLIQVEKISLDDGGEPSFKQMRQSLTRKLKQWKTGQ